MTYITPHESPQFHIRMQGIEQTGLCPIQKTDADCMSPLRQRTG